MIQCRHLLLLLLMFWNTSSVALTFDLQNPKLSNGILTANEGGVVTGKNLKVQARIIRYEPSPKGEGRLQAEGDLMVEFGSYIFVGDRLEYDFATQRGTLFNGRTAVEPWFFGGEEIELLPDGSFLIKKGYATTSENNEDTWKIETEYATLKNFSSLHASNVTFRLLSFPVLWFPKFRMDLKSIFDSPFRYTARWGGSQGPMVGVRYQFAEWRGLTTRLIADYRLRHGFGGGVEFDYHSPDHKEHFHSISYFTNDTVRAERKTRSRYRLKGDYSYDFDCGKTTLIATYDKISDKEMPTDYGDSGLSLKTPERTQIEVRRQDPDWIISLLARFRANDFETVKKELPTLKASFKPIPLGNTGIISENAIQLSYLELEYTEKNNNLHDYNSPRYELQHKLYRPIHYKGLNITPKLGTVAIYYGNNPNQLDRWMTIGLFECDASMDFYKTFSCWKHVVTPYVTYFYYTSPSTPPSDHYIFDIDDGWDKLHTLRFGVSNTLYKREGDCTIFKKCSADLFAYAFFDTDTFSSAVPKVYGTFDCLITPWIRGRLETAWDIEDNILDHWNYRTDWTVSDAVAFSAEYRHRSPKAWRKVDHTNFILESSVDRSELCGSPLSDRRDTFLFRGYYRFHPQWALSVHSLNGWNRKKEKSYHEYQVDLLGSIQSTWHIKLSHRHRSREDRFLINFSVGLRKPEPSSFSGS